jgi:uncharacterized protein YndB with AHSA1/START domain
MLIRKPASLVFQAFTDPEVTTNFWFTKSSGRLAVGKKVTWQWEMYGASVDVHVNEIIPNEKISVEWGDPPTTIDFEFQSITGDKTYVTIKNYGLNFTGDELIDKIKDATGGFTTVLDGLKAYLEHGLNLNLIADKYPKEITQHGK